MTDKLLFMKEIEKIHDDKLLKAVEKMVNTIPEYFWVIPASSSGKYHPKCDLGVGGLVRHSLMVCTIAVDLLKAEIFVKDTEYNEDIIRIATLFHDSYKSGIPEANGSHSEYTVFEHPLIAADKIWSYLFSQGIDAIYINSICDAIKSHMGKWNTSKKYSEAVLPVPKTDMEKLIHTADYIASRKYIGGLEEWDNSVG